MKVNVVAFPINLIAKHLKYFYAGRVIKIICKPMGQQQEI